MFAAESTSKAETASSFTQAKHPRRRGRIDVQMVQNVLLIWLDNNIDQNSSSCQKTIGHLRCAVNAVNIFTDDDECMQFLEDMAEEKVCMIISGALCEKIVSRVHELSQIDSIFIFCSNKTDHEEWTKKWPKIKDIYTEIRSICAALKQVAQRCEQNAISISIMDANDILPNKSLNQIDPSFMYTQIMKEILLTIDFEQQHIAEFIQHCRQALDGNSNALKVVDQLAEEYQKQTPIWWYTRESFLYPMLNRALRMVDADLMVKLGFFIADLHRQIKELHHKEFGDDGSNQKFIGYRGQGMKEADFEKMVASKDGLISFNCFLSTSRDLQVAAAFAESVVSDAQLVGVLFVMTIDPTLPGASFASVAKVGAMGAEEDEVLFSMNTVFRIGQIKQLDDHPRLFRVELSMTSETDEDLHRLMDYIREETSPEDEDGWYRLGLVLWHMGETAKAQQLYEVLLEQTTEERTRVPIYGQLAIMANVLGQYHKAIEYYEESIRIEQKQNPCDHLNLASSYGNIGSIYLNMGDYPKALSYYEKALVIRQQSLPPTHPHLASSYGNIGLIYLNMGDYSKALLSHEKALTIRQQSLPPTHPDFASSYNNLGLVYYTMGDYQKALSSHEKALATQQQSLPATHSDFACSYGNIGSMYCQIGDYPKALLCHEKALAIKQQSLPPNHPDLASSYGNIGNVYYKMGDYPKALSSHEKALAMKQQSLPATHPDFASSYNNIGVVYYKMGDYPKALLSHEKALTIKQQSLPPNHPDLASSYNNMARAHENIKNYWKAHSFYECAIDVAQRSLPSDHPRLRKYRNHLARIKTKL